MVALLEGDLSTASAEADVPLTRYFTTDDMMWLWRLRLDRLTYDPVSGRWGPHVAVSEGVVVGHAGFHGPPDETGTVEIAYSVDPAHRRQGYATAMVGALLRHATDDPTVATVRACISPGNTPSLATIANFGFTHIEAPLNHHRTTELTYELPTHNRSSFT